MYYLEWVFGFGVIFYLLALIMKKLKQPRLVYKKTPKPDNPKTHAKKHIQWNAEIRTSEICKAPKSEQIVFGFQHVPISNVLALKFLGSKRNVRFVL